MKGKRPDMRAREMDAATRDQWERAGALLRATSRIAKQDGIGFSTWLLALFTHAVDLAYRQRPDDMEVRQLLRATVEAAADAIEKQELEKQEVKGHG